MRYFFDVHDGVHFIDKDGTELSDVEAARVAAAKLAGRTLADHAEKFWQSSRELRVTVRDRGGPLFTIFTLVQRPGTTAIG